MGRVIYGEVIFGGKKESEAICFKTGTLQQRNYNTGNVADFWWHLIVGRRTLELRTSTEAWLFSCLCLAGAPFLPFLWIDRVESAVFVSCNVRRKISFCSGTSSLKPP